IAYLHCSEPSVGVGRRFWELHTRLPADLRIALISLGAEPDSPVSNIKIDGGLNLWKAFAKKANSSKLSLYAHRALHYSLSPRLVRKYSRRASIFHEQMSPLPILSPIYQKRQPLS